MNITLSYVDTKKAIADQLISLGWSPVGDFDMQQTAAVASKDFSTPAGTKTAFAFLQPSEDSGHLLVGAYYSQGNNVLSATSAFIADAITPEAIASQAHQYAESVDSVVANTFVMMKRSA